MALELGKKLSKGERINLTKDVSDSKSEKVASICIGANWGGILRKSWGRTTVEAVDLDTTALMYDSSKNKVDEVSFRHLRNSNMSVTHSGDDREGDANGDDGLDNEVISTKLNNIPSNVEYIVFVLNSFNHQKFDEIPYARLRVYEGTPSKVNNVLASYEMSAEPGFKGKEAIVLGHLYRKDGWWKFKADGNTSTERNIDEISRGSAREVL